ncbi:hypothetical protein Rhe02_58270 [Rhizocola hellebori]|uniref:Uncharacterized protein n=1 Tax=Rhizocola hellebori TaxID=1392758 RepID=A0A8J3QDR8_9ACTN|nr:hypothetical protein [Rhizocola hellebori]GIH07760.1 hypothetical protein Rhe02_58270 [Rhizocola hellebori]
MSYPMQTNTIPSQGVPWFVPTGNRRADLQTVMELIIEAYDSDSDLMDGQAQFSSATLTGVGKAFMMGPQNFPSVSAFVNMCVQLSNLNTDPPDTLADLYCRWKADSMAEDLPKLPTIEEKEFRSELRRLRIRRTCKLTALDTVCIFKNAAVWTDGLGAHIVVGFTAKSLTQDHYTILIRVSDMQATGEQIMQKLWAVCDGQAAPKLSELVEVSYFAVGGSPKGDSISLSCQVLVQLGKPQLKVLGTWLTDDIHADAKHKAIAILADGQMCCTQYEANGFAAFRTKMELLPLSAPDFFGSVVTELKLPSVVCHAGAVQLLQGQGLVVTGIQDCVVVGVRGLHHNVIEGAIVCGGSDTGTDCGEDLLDSLLAIFDGTRAPLLTDMTYVKFFFYGGHYGGRGVTLRLELLCEFYERGLDLLGMLMLLHSSDADLVKALVIKPNGVVVGTGYPPDQERETLGGITLLDIEQLRGSAKVCGYYEVGKDFNDFEYNVAQCMPDDGIWTDHMGPCVTIGFTGVYPQTGKRCNALLHSLDPDARGGIIIKALQSLPDYHKLVNVGFFIVGGSPDNADSMTKIASVVQELNRLGLPLIGNWPTISEEHAGRAKAVMITKDGRLFGSIYQPKN